MKKSIISYEMFQDKICENTYEALKALVETSYYTQLAHPPNFNGIGGETQAAWREYCTVKLCTSRRAGHSSAICRVAYEYFKKAMILSPKEDMSLRLRAEFPNLIGKVSNVEVGASMPKGEMAHVMRIDNGSEYYFHTINRLEHLRGFEFEAVFVDCSCLLSKDKMNKIYDNLGPSMARYPQNFFIFIQ